MRYKAAKSYLSHKDVAGTEVAYLLGFAEQSSLNRAFKRWSGLTPSIDVTVSRAFGRLSPYAGLATTASLALERSPDVDLNPATADGSLSYARVSYGWRALSLSAEIEKGTRVSYALRVGTRF